MENSNADIDDAFASSESVDATPLQIERAKVLALQKQLSRTLDEKQCLEIELSKTQSDLTKQLQATLRLQKNQAKATALTKQVPVAPCGDTSELKRELSSTKNELADVISTSSRREARLQKLQEQCNSYKEQLDSLKQQEQGDGGDDDKRNMKKLINNLEHQRSELLALVQKQQRLIDILRQQRAHVEAAAVLNIPRKDCLKEVTNCK